MDGYNLIIFREPNKDKTYNSCVARATKIHLIKKNNDFIALEKEEHRKRLLTYEGVQTSLNMAEFWHTNSKLPANVSLVLCFNGGTDNAHKYTMVMDSNQHQGKWKLAEHKTYSYHAHFPNFIFIMEGMSRSGMFLKFMSLLLVLPFPLWMARYNSLPTKTIGVEVFDVFSLLCQSLRLVHPLGSMSVLHLTLTNTCQNVHGMLWM